jgi:AmmeMemoRadiSam system protein A
MASSETGASHEGAPHPLVQLARAAVEKYVLEGKRLTPADAPASIEGSPAGVFVTIHKARSGDLRGCIGTIEPTESSLAQETIQNAIAAATRDPRFPPIAPRELNDLAIDVSVLYPPEPIDSLAQLDPRRYGVIVQSRVEGSYRGGRRGLLLPDIPGIDDAETQVEYARQKAWIRPDEPVDLFRFRVEKYT